MRVVRDAEQLGILDTGEAQRIADEANLDLVEVAPTAIPPVVRIMDYGKFKYQQAKKERDSRKSSRHSSLREVRMRVKIDEHDIAFKARTAAQAPGRRRQGQDLGHVPRARRSPTPRSGATCWTASTGASAMSPPSSGPRRWRAGCSRWW